MPIDLMSSIKKTSQWAFGSPLLNSILGSSLFVALTVALVMMLLIMIMYPAKKGTSFTVVAKMFIYMFFTSLLVIFLHDGVIKFMFEEEHQSKAADDMMRGVSVVGRGDDVYAVGHRAISPSLADAVNEMKLSIDEPAAPVVVKAPPVVSIVEGGNSVLTGAKPIKARLNPFKL